MKGQDRGQKVERKWSETELKKLTHTLVREGLYRSETEPVLPRQLRAPIEALQPYSRTIDPKLKQENRTALDRLFRDECAERAQVVTPSHPGYLHDGQSSLLMRRSPVSLREAIARDLVENGTLNGFSTKYRLSALLISRGIRDKETIEDLSLDSVVTFKEFEKIQSKFEQVVSSAKTNFFAKNTHLDSRVSPQIWEKFEAAWKKLTIKQRSALEIHIMCEDPLSLEEGAKRLKISKASFRERVQSGVKKIEKALPELVLLKSAKKSPVTAEPAKEKPNTFQPRKKMPNRAALQAWLDRTTHEPKWTEWDSVFKNPEKMKIRAERRFRPLKFNPIA